MVDATDILLNLEHRREALGMPLKELSKRANVSLGTIRRAAAGESGIAIGTVTAIANSLGIRDLRAFSGARRPDRMRYLQAALKARKIVGMVQGTSALEGQAVSQPDRKLLIANTINELLSGTHSRLWASM